MRKFVSLIVIGFCLLSDLQAQPVATVNEELKVTEKILKVLSDSIIRGSTDIVRRAAVAEFNERMLDLLKKPATFSYPFDSIKALSKLRTSDNRTRIYTWFHQSRDDGTYRYFGLVQRFNPAKTEMRLIGLIEQKCDNDTIEMKELNSDSWMGAVYYDLIEKKVKSGYQYYLLGWIGHDRYTTRKVLEVLTFDRYDNVAFGAPVFIDEKNKKKWREVFEFTAEAVMLLRYEEKKKMFVFDHLSPASPSAKGQFRYYGPDFTYDGYRFKKGLWYYKSNLDMRN